MAAASPGPASIDPAREDFAFPDWPFYRLARLVGLYNQRATAALKPLGIDVPRWRVLMILAHAGTATTSRIAEDAVVGLSTMAKIVNRMETEALVTTRVSPADARATEVCLTPKGAALCRTARASLSKLSRDAFAGLSAAEIEAVNALSLRLYGNLRG